MGYSDTIGVILYWKPDQIFVIHRAHHIWFDEDNYRLSIEDKHTPGSLLLQQDPGSLLYDSDLINLIPCDIDLTSNLFCDTPSLAYTIELPPAGKKVGFNLLDDEDFTIPYVTDTIPNPPAGHQPPTRYK